MSEERGDRGEGKRDGVFIEVHGVSYIISREILIGRHKFQEFILGLR